jgi:putative PIG3 family NAD(P)H quinone oxidoreductase
MADVISTSMSAVAISRPGAPEVLTMVDRPVPSPRAGEVLIKVEAAGVNRPDVLQRLGVYPPPPDASDLPGLEVAGTVVLTAPDVHWPKVGERVCALVNGGGYAEYALAPHQQCLPVPKGLSMVEAASLPETYFTVWTNVFDRCKLAAGESFLVHGGASGIGTAAIQMCKALGATVFATAGTQEKCEAAVRLGATYAVNYKTEDFVEAIRARAPEGGIDVILDMVGGDYTQKNLDLLRPNGRVSQIYFMRGQKVEVNLGVVMAKRLILTGSTLRPRTAAEKGEIAQALKTHIWPLLEERRILPVVHKSFPLSQAAEAHRLMEADTHIGKIVLVSS